MKPVSAILISALLAGPALAQTEPLPKKTDIPSDFSTIICPNEGAARTMLNDYHVRGGTWLDTTQFFAGLRTTGCEQRSGPLQIVHVMERKTVVPEVGGAYIFYRAVRPSGETVFGIVHERGNDIHPRTPFERWTRNYAPDLRIIAKPQDKRTYVCATPAAAIKVVAAIPDFDRKGVNRTQQVRARDAAIKASGCAWATGTFTVIAVHKSIFISLGYEAGQSWTALTVKNGSGKTVGLLHDVADF